MTGRVNPLTGQADSSQGPVALWFLYQWKHDGRMRSEQRARVYESETDAAADAYRMHSAGHLPIGVQYPDGRTAHAISPWEWDAFNAEFECQERARAAVADLGPASRGAVSPFGPFGVHSAEGQVPADAPEWVGDQDRPSDDER